MPVQINQLGAVNMQLVLDLAQGNSQSSGYAISDFVHDKSYNYDLSFGVHHKDKPLRDARIGVKYYCYSTLAAIDMKKRIVHIYNPHNRRGTQKFYRLIHTSASPGLRDNSYSTVEEIVGWQAELARIEAAAAFQREAARLGGIDASHPGPPVDRLTLRRTLNRVINQ
jgi:hypothetical protein